MSEQDEIQQPIEPTTQEAAPTTASDSGENHDNKPLFSEEQQKVVNDIAAKKAFEVREARREAEALKKQLEEAKAKIPQQTRPEVPEVDPYSDTYEDDLRRRDEAIRAQAQFDADQKARSTQAEQARAQAEKQKQEETEKMVKAYGERALKLGVNANELQAAETKIIDYGIDPDVANFILSDDQGPLIVKYLADNPLELDAMRGLSPQYAAIRIHTDIKQKASSLGVKTPTAPAPVETLNGSGMPLKERGPKGATFV